MSIGEGYVLSMAKDMLEMAARDDKALPMLFQAGMRKYLDSPGEFDTFEYETLVIMGGIVLMKESARQMINAGIVSREEILDKAKVLFEKVDLTDEVDQLIAEINAHAKTNTQPNTLSNNSDNEPNHNTQSNDNDKKEKE